MIVIDNVIQLLTKLIPAWCIIRCNLYPPKNFLHLLNKFCSQNECSTNLKVIDQDTLLQASHPHLFNQTSKQVAEHEINSFHSIISSGLICGSDCG